MGSRQQIGWVIFPSELHTLVNQNWPNARSHSCPCLCKSFWWHVLQHKLIHPESDLPSFWKLLLPRARVNTRREKWDLLVWRQILRYNRASLSRTLTNSFILQGEKKCNLKLIFLLSKLYLSLFYFSVIYMAVEKLWYKHTILAHSQPYIHYASEFQSWNIPPVVSINLWSLMDTDTDISKCSWPKTHCVLILPLS